ncbi:MAG TPA: RNA polymerase sigma factor [Chryseosolibacter sp.]|nr:RNA polymerase sigma factor [Chryseosolibacter sp.]
MPDFLDREFVEKAIAGDTKAFRVLVERNQSFVYTLAYRFVGNVNDAEDIAQETFVRLWKNLHRYKPEVKLTTWLYKIVTNLCLDHLKSGYRKKAKRMDDVEGHKEMDGGGTADQLILNDELQRALALLTEELTPKQKAVFVLRDMEDVSTEEVCRVLSMSSGNMKSNLYYARKKMGEMITLFYQTKKSRKE